MPGLSSKSEKSNKSNTLRRKPRAKKNTRRVTMSWMFFRATNFNPDFAPKKK